MIDEWIESSATAVRISSDVPKTQSVTINGCFKKRMTPKKFCTFNCIDPFALIICVFFTAYVSKIPSPVFIRRELNLKEPANSSASKKMQSVSVGKSKHVGAVESKVISQPNFILPKLMLVSVDVPFVIQCA